MKCGADLGHRFTAIKESLVVETWHATAISGLWKYQLDGKGVGSRGSSGRMNGEAFTWALIPVAKPMRTMFR